MDTCKNIIGPGDRFIPRRAGVNFELSGYNLSVQDDEIYTQDEKSSKKSNAIILRREKYLRKLVFGTLLAAVNTTGNLDSVLHFSKPPKDYFEFKNFGNREMDWPCVPRKTPISNIAISVLDLPGIVFNICHHNVDWSNRGYMSTIVENEVHSAKKSAKRSNKIFERTFVTNTNNRVQECIRWNNAGLLMALGLLYKSVGIWSLKTRKIEIENFCLCPRLCKVTTIVWTKDDKIIISGCDSGRMTVWTNTLQRYASIFNAHQGSIINLKFSKGERFLCSSGIDGPVRIWRWPELTEHFEIRHTFPIMGIAWHPWKESLLCIGGYLNFTLGLFDVNSYKALSYKLSPTENTYIDCLTWSSRTGELIVSYWNEDTSTNSIAFLSALDEVDDVILLHRGRVLYLLWNRDGTQLATVGCDEVIYIWKYIDDSEIKKVKKKKHLKLVCLPTTSKVLNNHCIR